MQFVYNPLSILETIGYTAHSLVSFADGESRIVRPVSLHRGNLTQILHENGVDSVTSCVAASKNTSFVPCARSNLHFSQLPKELRQL